MSTKELFVLILTPSCKDRNKLSSEVVMDTILVTDLACESVTCVDVMLFLVPFVMRHFFLQAKQFHLGCNLISINIFN